MTREIAKVMTKILSAYIAAYEEQIGEIKITPLDIELEGEAKGGESLVPSWLECGVV